MSAAIAYTEDFPADHDRLRIHNSRVGGENHSEQAMLAATPIVGAPARANIPADQCDCDAHTTAVDGDPSSGGQRNPGTQVLCAVAPTSPDPANEVASSKTQSPGSGTPDSEQVMRGPMPTLTASARGPLPPAPATDAVVPNVLPPVLADPLLTLAADVLDDLERVRIANENRLRQLTRTEKDSDGLERGFGLPEDHPDVKRLAALVEGLATAEHQAELNLNRLMRAHPLGPWVKQTRGVGEKQGARLLASIGDPYWNALYNRPRTVSELWAYSGYHVLRTGHCLRDDHMWIAGPDPAGGDPGHGLIDTQDRCAGVAATRARGQRANWSATAKMRAYLVAVSIVKAGGPYREVYDAARAKYDDALHGAECRRCGPSGKPAPVGSPLSAGHQHARALRAVAKEVLKDLWREAKRIHEGGTSA